MKVLLTGAFGNIGVSTLEALLRRGHQVRCFDVKTKMTVKTARQFQGKAEIRWGDLRSPDEVAAAVADQEAVIHLGFVIPRLSVTGVSSKDVPDWAEAVNVGGMTNLLKAMQAAPQPPKLLFSSSLHVYGQTQDQPPPRTVEDLPQPVEYYARHKVECERLARESGLTWAIFRLGAALPVRLTLSTGMFDVPLNNRIEFVHSRDVGLALANALETDEVWGKIWLIGGGPRCQVYQRDLVEGVLNAVGVGMLPDNVFPTIPYAVDWLDTAESQRVLQFQQHTLQDYIQDVTAVLGYRRPLIRIFRPFIRAWLVNQAKL